MHIPKGDTALLELVRFDNALEAALADEKTEINTGRYKERN